MMADRFVIVEPSSGGQEEFLKVINIPLTNDSIDTLTETALYSFPAAMTDKPIDGNGYLFNLNGAYSNCQLIIGHNGKSVEMYFKAPGVRDWIKVLTS